MNRRRMAIILLILLVVAPAVIAVNYRVGDSSGWNLGVNYNSWVSGKTFVVGDTLQFLYGPSHSVDEVDRQGRDNCDPTRATNSFQGGNTTIRLTTPGPMFFICPTPGHCTQGMSLAINVTPASSTPVPAPAPSLSPSPPSPADAPKASSPEGGVSMPPEATTDTPAPGAMSPEGMSAPEPTTNRGSKGLSYQMVAWTVILGCVLSSMG